MNKVILVGNCCSDPTITYTKYQKPMSHFQVKVSRGYRDADGKVLYNYILCRAWGKLGEVVHKHVKKHQILILEGELYVDSYKPRGSEKNVYFTYVLLHKLEWGGIPSWEMVKRVEAAREGKEYSGPTVFTNAGSDAPPESSFEDMGTEDENVDVGALDW